MSDSPANLDDFWQSHTVDIGLRRVGCYNVAIIPGLVLDEIQRVLFARPPAEMWWNELSGRDAPMRL